MHCYHKGNIVLYEKKLKEIRGFTKDITRYGNEVDLNGMFWRNALNFVLLQGLHYFFNYIRPFI